MHTGYLKAKGKSIDWFFDGQSGLAKFFGAGQHVTNLMGKVSGGYCPKCNHIQLPQLTLKIPKA
jgi:hypothetical protein